jgi:hypothetical protein
MLHTADRYSNRERYSIHPQKSAIIQIGRHRQPTTFQWEIAGTPVAVGESITHLGITHKGIPSREHCHTTWVYNKLKGARRTVYGLMGTGLHGRNGVDPRTGICIYQAYALPKLLYGLDVNSITKTQLKSLEEFHLGMLRALQSLPERTATEAVYLLSGCLPVLGHVHMRKLSLVGAIARSEHTTLQTIAVRQCALKEVTSTSWFLETEMLLLKYELPTTRELLVNPVDKGKWKRQVKAAVLQHWSNKLRREASEDKSSLSHLNLQHTQIGSIHHIWRFLIPCMKDVRRAVLKAKFLTGSYATQERLSYFSKGDLSSLCPVCQSAVEDVRHLLLWCPATHEARVEELAAINLAVCEQAGPEVWRAIANSGALLVQLILDSTTLMDQGLLPSGERLLETLEWHSRRLCYSVHCKRAHLLEMKKKQAVKK